MSTVRRSRHLVVAAVLLLGACGGGGGDDGDAAGAGGAGASGGDNGAEPSGATPEAPISNGNAEEGAIGSRRNAAEIGQWFDHGSGWSARLASVRAAGPGEVTEAQSDGPFAVFVIEARYDGDEDASDLMRFDVDVDTFDEAFCDGITSSTAAMEVQQGSTVEYRYCHRLAPGPGEITVRSFMADSEHRGAAYAVDGPGQGDGGADSGTSGGGAGAPTGSEFDEEPFGEDPFDDYPYGEDDTFSPFPDDDQG